VSLPDPNPFPAMQPVDRGLENAMMVMAREIANLADSINHLAVASQALRTPPGASIPPSTAAAPLPPVAGQSGPPGGGGASVTTQEKMSKKVFAICAQNGWEIGDIGQRVTGRDIGRDSRKWSVADLGAVLDQMKEWGFN
jgi:hypothetical protein